MGGIQIDSHSVVSYISQTLGMGSGNDFRSFHLLFLVWRGEKVLGWQAPSMSGRLGMGTDGKLIQWTCRSEMVHYVGGSDD